MKQILVVCVGIPTGESITAELNAIFKGVAQAEFCLCHQLREQAEGRDIVLFSSKYSQRDRPLRHRSPGPAGHQLPEPPGGH